MCLLALGLSRCSAECAGNGRLELQIVDVPHRQEDFMDGDSLLFEVQDPAYVMQGLLAYD